MKTRSLFFLIALFQMYKIYSQTPICIPNPIYKDSAAGIYPRPYNDSTKLGGIPQVACINKTYEVPLTVNIPDTVSVPFAGTILTLALISASIDTANAVIGLPKGIKYSCNPGNCVFDKKKLGCIVLKGVATEDNKPGNYDLVINLKLVTSLGSFDVTFPGTIFPGKYFITVAEKNSTKCVTSDVHSISSFQGRISAFPNPVKDQINFMIDAVKAGVGHLAISDITGRTLMTRQIMLRQGENYYKFPVDQLSNGSYYYTLTQNKLSSVKKFIVFKD